MAYRISIIINTVLSLLFIFVSVYSVIIERDISSTSLTIAGTLFILSVAFLWFDIICLKINRANKELSFISKRLKNTGKVIFAFSALAVLAVIFFTISAFVAFPESDTSGSTLRITLFAVTMFIFFLLAITGIVNLIFFSRSLRKNKQVVNTVINDIGSQA